MCLITRDALLKGSRKAYDTNKAFRMKFGGLDVRRTIGADHRHTSKMY